MKKILSLLLTCLLLASCFSLPAFAETTLDVQVNGHLVEFEAAPFIDENDRTLVPAIGLLAVLSTTGEDVTVTESSVSILGASSLSLSANAAEAVVNGEAVALDSSAKVIDGILFIPLRFVCEALDCDVTFYSASPLYGNRNLVSVERKTQTLTVFMPEELYATDSANLMEIAAAITGIDGVSNAGLGADSVLEKINLIIAAGEPAVIIDNGIFSDEIVKNFASAGAFAKIDDAIAKYSPSALEWINASEEIKQLVTDAEGNIIAFPVEHSGKIERLFVASTVGSVEKAVSLIHGYREVIKGLEEASDVQDVDADDADSGELEESEETDDSDSAESEEAGEAASENVE